jgi:hypothetical protein
VIRISATPQYKQKYTIVDHTWRQEDEEKFFPSERVLLAENLERGRNMIGRKIEEEISELPIAADCADSGAPG